MTEPTLVSKHWYTDWQQKFLCVFVTICLYGRLKPSSMGLLRVGGTGQRVLEATMPRFL